MPSSSEDNSGFETESSPSSISSTSLKYPDTIKFNENEKMAKEKRKSPKTIDWIMEELLNEKQKKKQKIKQEDEFG